MCKKEKQIIKTADIEYNIEMFKAGVDVAGSILIGPLWSLKNLVNLYYGKVKKDSYNWYLYGIGYKFVQDNLTEKDIKKLSKKLENEKFHHYISIVLDSMIFSKSHNVNIMLGIITAKYLIDDELDYEDLTLITALKDMYDKDLKEFVNFYNHQSQRLEKEVQNIVFIDTYTNEQDLILEKLLSCNIFGKDKAGNRLFNDNDFPLVFVKTSVSDRLYNYIIALNLFKI